MKPPHRDFPAYEPKPGDDGPTFTLGGRLLHCLPQIPAGAYVDLPMTFMVDDCYRFIRAVLVDEDQEAFDDVIHRRDVIVPLLQLQEVVRWLLGIDGGLSPFAPGQPSSSSNGHGTTAPTSAPNTSASGSSPAPSGSTTSPASSTG